MVDPPRKGISQGMSENTENCYRGHEKENWYQWRIISTECEERAWWKSKARLLINLRNNQDLGKDNFKVKRVKRGGSGQILIPNFSWTSQEIWYWWPSLELFCRTITQHYFWIKASQSL